MANPALEHKSSSADHQTELLFEYSRLFFFDLMLATDFLVYYLTHMLVQRSSGFRLIVYNLWASHHESPINI